ncbi:MAG: hypothetical protein CMC82_09760 [Flavobacteriaceae bacterium]|nr:hypothetical protein [Flavobacteriaceae bacterium]
MSKYTLTKHIYSIDVMRNSDNHACGFMCSNVFHEADELYMDKILYTANDFIPDGKKVGDVMLEADTLPEGKKFGDVKKAGRGWVQEDWNWDTELQRVFGEVDADVKKELTDYFTSDVKAKYLANQKGG